MIHFYFIIFFLHILKIIHITTIVQNVHFRTEFIMQVHYKLILFTVFEYTFTLC
jgi:hypothetical protein